MANKTRNLAVGLLLAACTLATTAQAQPGVGDKAPDFTLVDTQNVSHTLSTENVDHVVVLYFVGYG